jgi:hypothetical protein
MSSENDQGKSVNGNDNQCASWLRMGNLDLNEKCAPFIPLALASHNKSMGILLFKNHLKPMSIADFIKMGRNGLK